MDEVITCQPCQMEFHQSFLSAHVEAFHVQERQEEVVLLSCLSCSFSVSARHKNTMAQHCLVSGHSPGNVEVQFNSFLINERTRIAEILSTSVAILANNFEETRKSSPASPIKQSLNHKKPSNEELSDQDKQIQEKMEIKNIDIKTPSPKTPSGRKSRKRRLCQEEKENEFETIKKEMTQDIPEIETKENRRKMNCQECEKEITISGHMSHTLQYIIGHVLSHLPDLKLFSCRFCDFQTKYRRDLIRHHHKKRNEGIFVPDREFTGNSQENDEMIRSKLREYFPEFQLRSGRDLFKYC